MALASPARPISAARRLLVAFGIETVYGLGADATNARMVAAIYAAKRPSSVNPLICRYSDAETAFAHGIAYERARALVAPLGLTGIAVTSVPATALARRSTIAWPGRWRGSREIGVVGGAPRIPN